MKFTAWELAALEQCVERGVKDGSIEKLSGERLLARVQREKPRQKRHVLRIKNDPALHSNPFRSEA